MNYTYKTTQLSLELYPYYPPVQKKYRKPSDNHLINRKKDMEAFYKQLGLNKPIAETDPEFIRLIEVNSSLGKKSRYRQPEGRIKKTRQISTLDNEFVFTANDAAAYLNVPLDFICRHLSLGSIPHLKTGKSFRILKQNVILFAQDHANEINILMQARRQRSDNYLLR